MFPPLMCDQTQLLNAEESCCPSKHTKHKQVTMLLEAKSSKFHLLKHYEGMRMILILQPIDVEGFITN